MTSLLGVATSATEHTSVFLQYEGTTVGDLFFIDVTQSARGVAFSVCFGLLIQYYHSLNGIILTCPGELME